MLHTNQKTVVLLHGFGEDHTIFKYQIPQLKTKYTLFTPDLPGSGLLNQFVFEKEQETLTWMADWLYRQLKKEQITRCIMLGHSMGGYITLAFAEKYPEMLTGFGLLHSTAFADDSEKKKTRHKAINFMQKKGSFTLLKTSIPGLFSSDFAKNHAGEVEQLIQKAKALKSDTLIVYYRAMIERPDRTNLLKNAKVPVLIIAGSNDTTIPLSDLLAQAKMPSICHFHILKNVGHMGMVEEKSGFNQILLHFLSAV